MKRGKYSRDPSRADAKTHSDEQIIVRCTRFEKKRWQDAARATGDSLSSIVRKAVNEYLQPSLPQGERRP